MGMDWAEKEQAREHCERELPAIKLRLLLPLQFPRMFFNRFFLKKYANIEAVIQRNIQIHAYKEGETALVAVAYLLS